MKDSRNPRGSAARVDKLRLLPGFDELSEDRLAEVLAMTSVRQYEPGETIIAEGERDRRVFFLVQGMARVVKGDVEIGRIRRLGEVFGEMGVIDGSPRSATVQAVQRTLCVSVEAGVLDSLSGESKLLFSAVLFKSFAERLAERLREMNTENVGLRETLRRHGVSQP